jgi:MoaA/NifB/PqqE/SkfB family radical SAM enzyme
VILALSSSYQDITIDARALDVSLTTHCQARCRSCDRTNSETGERNTWLPLQHMELSDVKTLIDNSSGIHMLRFAGEYGDPLMYPHLTEVLEYCFENGVDHVMLNTNGGLMKPEWWTKVGNRYGSKFSCMFGIDGTDHETNWKYREGVNFDRAWANMLALSQTSARTIWQFIVFEHNWHQVKTAIELSKTINLERMFFILNCSPHSPLTNDHRNQVRELIQKEGYPYDEP